MVRIAICDDEIAFAKLLESKVNQYIEKLGEEAEIDIMEPILYESLSQYQIVLLDIDMPEKSGLEIAEYLYANKTNVCIIFVSSMEHLVYKSLQFQPYRFVRKTHIDTELEEAVTSCIKKQLEEECIVLFRTERGEVRQAIHDIIYIESYSHYLKIHTATETLFVRGSMKEYENVLTRSRFIRTHKSYLVNGTYIYGITSTKIELKGGKELHVGRSYYKEAKEAYYKLLKEI